MGAYLGYMQSFPIKTRISQRRKWIVATSFGVAIGTPLSWFVFQWIFESPLVERVSGILFFYLYQYLAFGVLLGLCIGVAQWFVLKQQVRNAGRWILALPILFTGGMAFTKLGLVYQIYVSSVQRLLESVAHQIFRIRVPIFATYLFGEILPTLLALLMVSMLSGVFLEWLFRDPRKRSEEP
jgi:hypothetical protein